MHSMLQPGLLCGTRAPLPCQGSFAMPELLCRARDPLSWQISFVAPSLLWVARALLCQGSFVVPGILCVTRNPWLRQTTMSRQGSLVAASGFLSHSVMAPCFQHKDSLVAPVRPPWLHQPGLHSRTRFFFAFRLDLLTERSLYFLKVDFECYLVYLAGAKPRSTQMSILCKHLELGFNFQLITNIQFFSIIIYKYHSG